MSLLLIKSLLYLYCYLFQHTFIHSGAALLKCTFLYVETSRMYNTGVHLGCWPCHILLIPNCVGLYECFSHQTIVLGPLSYRTLCGQDQRKKCTLNFIE